MSDNSPVGKVLACVELAERHEGAWTYLTMLVSIPGREGALRRTWRLQGAIVDGPTALDIASTVQKTVLDAFFVAGGIQQALLER